jgi:S1-C subfamily serine protease
VTEKDASIGVKDEASKPNIPPRKRRKAAGVICGVIAVVALCFGAGYGGSYLANQADNTAPIASFGAVKDDGNTLVTENEQTISAVAEEVSPSVVSIVTSGESFRRGYIEQAAGTGIVVSKNGYIMTNKHVVAGASTARVVTADGTTYSDVKIVGSDPLNDLAFLKIPNAKNLKPAILGDSKTVRIGQGVIAIGNALGQYQNTVTSGIISGLGRPVIAASDARGTNAESLNDLIQTDAAINSGNSGGPLLNLKGQVIGVNTAVASDAQSIGFAIPIGATKGILKHLIETGKVERAIIGVQYLSITPEVKKEYNLPVSQGDYIVATSGSAVQTNGPAANAGIKDKDIITKVNGVEIGPGRSIASLVGEFQPGDKVKLTVLRDGKTRDIQVTLGSYGN